MTADRISVGELQELLAAGRPVTVLDVRSPSDVDWEIPSAIHVDAYADLQSGRLGPLAELSLAQGPVVTVCGVGRTAAIATELLRANGVETLTLDGGMRSWSLAWNSATTTISGCKVIQVRRTGKGCLSYIVESRSEAIVIDASVDPDVYVRLISERGWRLVAVADTHIHADHLSRSRQLAHLEGSTQQELASRARLLHMSVSRLLQLPEATQVFPGHVSEAIPFDGRMLGTTVGTIRDTVALARLEEAVFVQAVLARIPPNPPNHSRIVEFNERGELPGDPQRAGGGSQPLRHR